MTHHHHNSHRATKILPHHRFSHSLGAPLARVIGNIEKVFDAPAHHHGANHQHFTVKVSQQVFLRGSNKNSIEGETVFVAVRFGDNEGLDAEIPGLAVGQEIELQGEYIDSDNAYPTPDNENPVLPVIHFTHHPVGFIEYQGEHYS
ncbi:MAG: hypothetical protein PHE55_04565 [Methylococcaceae bacterium]|nr:hypothetical protein [Methylococcaceae bacterium]